MLQRMDLLGLLVQFGTVPVGVEVLEFIHHSIVLSQEDCVQCQQGRMLIDTLVAGFEAEHALLGLGALVLVRLW